MKNFEGFIRKSARENNVEVQWQQLKFGYKRAKIPCCSWEEYKELEHTLKRNKALRVDCWTCFNGEFEAYIYIMLREDHIQLQAKNKAEQDKSDTTTQMQRPAA